MKVALLTTDSREHFKDYGNPQPYFGTAPEALLEGFKLLPDKVEVHVISCLQREPASSPTKLAENIYYHGLHVPNIGWLKTGYQGCIRSVRRKLREINPDIVHGQGTERECAICAAFSGFPNIFTLHGVMSSICKVTDAKPLSYYWFAKHLETIALGRTCGVIAISPYVEQVVATLAPETWLIPNAIRPQFFLPPTASPRAMGAPRLINVGVISPNKRQLELLELFIRLRADSEFNVTFVGKADRHDAYARKFMDLLHKANTLHGGVEHLNSVSAESLIELYDSSDAMVHFSREESFGLIFAEALARNLPVFASDVGAIREISEGVANCQVFGRNDFERLASAIGRWVLAGEYLAARPQKPNTVVESRYSPRIVAGMHLEAYKEILRNFSGANGRI